jgi:hypothetical protein
MKLASNWLGEFPARRGPLDVTLEAVPPPPLLGVTRLPASEALERSTRCD